MIPALLVVVAAASLWPGFVDAALVRGARAPAEVRAGLASLSPALARCAQGEGYDVVFVVAITGPGSVEAARPVVLSDDLEGRFSTACATAAFETLTLRDRGLEPPTRVLIRLTDDPRPADLPLHALQAALGRQEAAMRRCVEGVLRERRGVAGDVVARVRVTEGVVVGSSVVGDSPALVACVERELDGDALPPFPGPRTVVWTFSFWALPPGDQRRVPPWERRSVAACLGCDGFIP